MEKNLSLGDFPFEFFRGLGIEEIEGNTILSPGHHVLPSELKQLRPVLREKLGCRVDLDRHRKTRKHYLRIHGKHGDTFKELKESIKGRS